MKTAAYRLFCLLLCAVMVLGMFPAAAAAQETEEKTVEETYDGYVSHTENGITTHTPHTFTREKKISVPVEEPKATSIPAKKAVTENDWGDIYFETFEDLQKLCEKSYSTWTPVYYQGEGALTISKDLTIPSSLYVYGPYETFSVVVSKAATLTIEEDGNLDCDTLTVNGKIVCKGYSGIAVSKSLVINGSIVSAGNIQLSLDTKVTGVEKVTFENSYNGFRVYTDPSTFTEVKKIVAVAKKNPDITYSMVLYPEESMTFNSSITFPANTELDCYYEDKTLNIASGVTVTLNCPAYLNCNTVVKGKLVNNDEISFRGPSLKFTSTGSYAGSGSLYVFTEEGSTATDYTDIVSGLKITDDFVIEQLPYYDYPAWEIRDISSLTRLPAPTNLSWHKALEWDADAQEDKVVTRYGHFRFKPGKVLETDREYVNYQFILYRNGKQVAEMMYGFSPDYIADSDYIYESFLGNHEFTTGEYYFTIQARAESDEYYHSKVVKSSTWSYTKPGEKMGKATGLAWSGLRATWTPVTTSHTAHIVEFFYAPTADAEPQSIGTSSGEYLTDADVQHWQTENNGYGYYYFRVKTLSTNITKKANSSWTSMSKAFHYTADYKPAKPTLEIYTHQNGKPHLQWRTSAGSLKYQIYRATSKTGDYSHLKTVTFDYDPYYASYTDTSAKVGKTYYYKVRAISDNGVKSTFSSAKSIKVRLAWPEATITNDASTGKPLVKWNAVTGAEKYYVYRATSKNGDFKKVKTTTSRKFKDTETKAGKVYYYYVVAVHEKSSYNSYGSNLVYTRCDLKRPVVSIQLTSGGDPYLKWSKVSGAEKYFIYRATSKSGTYKRIGSTTTLKYVDKKATAGKTYYYKVKAIHSNSAANSAYSATDYIKAK